MILLRQNHPEEGRPLSNGRLAEQLEEIAELLEGQNANPFRVRAYRRAADTLRRLSKPVHEILAAEGPEGLIRLPGIGQSLARSLEQLTHTGRLALLESLRGEFVAERILGTVAGIGPELAARIHEELGIETLAELESAAYDGRLAQVPGMGRKRIRAVRESLAGRLGRRPRAPQPAPARRTSDQPPVGELLDIDREYRRKAELGRLPQIAPRRFNPTGEAWLPIFHTHRGDRNYTAMYSNTGRAHELGMTHDWVVIYRDDHEGHGQWTAITSQFGELKGRRIIRGREEECQVHYAELAESPTPATLFDVNELT